MILDSLTPYDRVQLLELYARTVMLLELGRCAEWADLFSPHAVVHCPGRNGEHDSVQFKGRDELLGLGQRVMLGEFDVAVGRLVPPLRTRHVLSNITLFESEPQRASGYAFVTVTTIGGPEPPRWLASGKYSDRLHRCGTGCWQFESRTFIPDSAAGVIPSANAPLMASAKR